MALTKNVPLILELGDMNELPLAASAHVYAGSAVGENGSGYARPLTAGDPFKGFAEREVNNTGSAGDKTTRVLQRGLIQLAVSGLAITDIGKPVYASDDGTFTLTATSNSYVGTVARYVSSGIGIIKFDVQCTLGKLGALTDSSGGTAVTTVVAVGVTNTGDRSAEINANFATLTAKVNALAKMLA